MSPTSYPDTSGLHPAISKGKGNIMKAITKAIAKIFIVRGPKSGVRSLNEGEIAHFRDRMSNKVP